MQGTAFLVGGKEGEGGGQWVLKSLCRGPGPVSLIRTRHVSTNSVTFQFPWPWIQKCTSKVEYSSAVPRNEAKAFLSVQWTASQQVRWGLTPWINPHCSPVCRHIPEVQLSPPGDPARTLLIAPHVAHPPGGCTGRRAWMARFVLSVPLLTQQEKKHQWHCVVLVFRCCTLTPNNDHSFKSISQLICTNEFPQH